MVIRHFIVILIATFSILPLSVQAQSSAEQLYAKGVEAMNTLAVASQHKAIGYFTKARVAYDSSSKKKLCSQQISVCKSIIKKLQSSGSKSQVNTKRVAQTSKGNEQKSTNQDARQAVDLGVSVLWATCNVGAEAPWQVGGLYGWADAQGTMRSLDWKDYLSGVANICGSVYDIAHVTWGGRWRLPRIEEFKELVYTCTWTWGEQNGQTGYTIKGRNGNSIFLPAGGHREAEAIVDPNTWGDYWTGDNYDDSKGWASLFTFNKEKYYFGCYFKSLGRCVRPVFDRNK